MKKYKEDITMAFTIIIFVILAYVARITIKVSKTVDVLHNKVEMLSDSMFNSAYKHLKEVEGPKVIDATSEITDSLVIKYKDYFFKNR